MASVVEAIRKAVNESSETRYAICKATGIDQGQLSRVMAGKSGLSVEAIEKLAEHLGLEIIIRPKRWTTKG